MKTIIYIAMPLVAVACHKPSKSQGPQNEYTCVCKIKTEFIDHCGSDSTTSSSSLSAKSWEEGNATCKQQDHRAADNYSITTKTCNVQ